MELIQNADRLSFRLLYQVCRLVSFKLVKVLGFVNYVDYLVLALSRV